jgi:hypothetical protein
MYKDVIPTPDDYAVQTHEISRSAQAMPVLLRRLVYLVMAQVRPGEPELMEVHMKVGDIARALGMANSNGNVPGAVYERIRGSIVEGLKEIIEIKQPDGTWTGFQWFARAHYDPKTDSMQIRLHEDLRPYVLQVQKAFRTFAIKDIARLQGKYALRIFELVMTREGQASKSGHWWYETEISELRIMFKIGPNEYPRMNDLRVRVIENPVLEINNADLGIHIVPEYIRRGRQLFAVRFNCLRINREDPKPVALPTVEEDNDEAFIETHPQRFAELLKEIKEEGELFPLAGYSTPLMRELAQRGEALNRLRKECSLPSKHSSSKPRKNK